MTRYPTDLRKAAGTAADEARIGDEAPVPAPGMSVATRHRRLPKARSEYLLSAAAFAALAFFILV